MASFDRRNDEVIDELAWYYLSSGPLTSWAHIPHAECIDRRRLDADCAVGVAPPPSCRPIVQLFCHQFNRNTRRHTGTKHSAGRKETSWLCWTRLPFNCENGAALETIDGRFVLSRNSAEMVDHHPWKPGQQQTEEILLQSAIPGASFQPFRTAQGQTESSQSCVSGHLLQSVSEKSVIHWTF